jgi:hypothetical protein
MWLFRKDKGSKKRLSAFADFISKEDLRSIQENITKIPVLQQEQIYYVIFQVRDETPESVQSCLSTALDLALRHRGVVESVLSSVVSVVFKLSEHQEEPLAVALLNELGSNVRVVCGHGEYLRGILGSPNRSHYGTIFPNIHGILQILFQLDFGSSKNI